MKEFSSNINEYCFDFLKAAPIVLGGKNSVIPHYEYDEVYFPQVDDIINAALSTFNIEKNKKD